MYEHNGLSGQNYNFDMGPHGICHIQPVGYIVPETTRAITQDVDQHVRKRGYPKGLLLDVRYVNDLSIIQLSVLVDTLSEYRLALAVVLPDSVQARLANLLGMTLPNYRSVAYMNSLEGAYSFILASQTSYLPGGSTGPLNPPAH